MERAHCGFLRDMYELDLCVMVLSQRECVRQAVQRASRVVSHIDDSVKVSLR